MKKFIFIILLCLSFVPVVSAAQGNLVSNPSYSLVLGNPKYKDWTPAQKAQRLLGLRPSPSKMQKGPRGLNMKQMKSLKKRLLKTGLYNNTPLLKNGFVGMTTGFTTGNGIVTGPSSTVYTDENLPSSFDWRNINGASYVTPIKNQNQCGGCYAFASTEMLESNILLRNNAPYDPVANNLDLATASILANTTGAPWTVNPYDGNYGCDGGNADPTMSFLMQVGLPSESACPFASTAFWIGNSGSCDPESSEPGWEETDNNRILAWANVETLTTDQAQNILNTKYAIANFGPVSQAMAVTQLDQWDFFTYTSGIFHCENALSSTFELAGYHMIDLVGWNDNVGDPTDGGYFILRNSWDTDWGINGYMYISYASFNNQTQIYSTQDIGHSEPYNFNCNYGMEVYFAYLDLNTTPAISVGPIRANVPQGAQVNINWGYTGTPGSTISVSFKNYIPPSSMSTGTGGTIKTGTGGFITTE